MNKKARKYCLFLLIPALMVVFLYGGGSAGEVMAKTFSTLLPTTTMKVVQTAAPTEKVEPTEYRWQYYGPTEFKYADTRETPPATKTFNANDYYDSRVESDAPYRVSLVWPTGDQAGDPYTGWEGSVFVSTIFPTETSIETQTMYPTDLETADPASIDKSAKTGDNNSFIWIALALLALSGGVVCYVLRKKTVKENK